MAEKSKNKKSNGEQSDFCDLNQVTLKPQPRVHHCLTIWLQIWYHSLLWGDRIRNDADLEKQNCLFGVHPAIIWKITFFYFLLLTNFTNSLEAFPTLVDKKCITNLARSLKECIFSKQRSHKISFGLNLNHCSISNYV